jgi:DnaJ like chaperone protein
MLGKWLGGFVGLLVGMLLMPWPWLLVPAILGFALGCAWDNHMQPSEIPSEMPKTNRELLNGPPRPMSSKPASSKGIAPKESMGASARRNQKTLLLPAVQQIHAPSEEELRESRMARLLCPILAQIAMADGPINLQEIRHIRLYFEEELGFSDWGLSAVRAELKAWLKQTADINTLLAKARPGLPPAMRVGFVSTLYELALADGELQRAERDLLQRVVRYLNLSDEQLQSITSAFFGDGSEHYAVLALGPHASDEEIKTAYRRLASAYHPDSNAGMSPRQIQKATETFHRIKEAYESLKKIRGF